MMDQDKHPGGQDDPIGFIGKMQPDKPRKSKEQVWAELESRIEEDLPVAKIHSMRWKLAAACTILLVGTILLSMRLYTETTITGPGSNESAFLPDGSKVYLNANSSISYQPYWWSMARRVELDGEAFFEVKKGKKFRVTSARGETTVLGTSFNIYASPTDYEVTCLTGRVKVKSLTSDDTVLITPNQMAVVDKKGELAKSTDVNAQLVSNWIFGKFAFTQVPLNIVFKKLSSRYGVEILNTENLTQNYTGSFVKERKLENILELVCKPFDLEFKKLPSGGYIIHPLSQ